jgi:hypothetical protein
MQLIASHSNAIKKLLNEEYGKMLLWFIKKDQVIMSLSFAGFIYAVHNVKKNPAAFFFSSWFILSLFVLFFHHPIWIHHRMLLMIPAAAMAGLPVYLINKYSVKKGVHPFGAFSITLFFVCMEIFIIHIADNSVLKSLSHPHHCSKDAKDAVVTAVIKKYAGPERLMITSSQMYAFRTNYAVPPFLVVTSLKRFSSHLLNDKIIINYIFSENVEQIVLNNRWKEAVRRHIKKAIKKKYKMVYRDRENHDIEIFVRRDLAQSP